MISFIVCTYNRDRYIFECLSHLAMQGDALSDVEIIVVNNNSTDNTEAEIKRFLDAYPSAPVRVLFESNQGLSYARNRGLMESAGDVIVFLDDDAFVSDNYVSSLKRYLSDYPDMMAFGGRIEPLFEDGLRPCWLSKWSMSWLSAIDKGNGVCLFEGKAFPIGANMGFRRSCIEKCGMFDTALGRSSKNLIGGEEKAYFYRISGLGLKVYYFPELFALHLIPASRTTFDYIRRFGRGVGASEYLRTKESHNYTIRLFREAVKWSGTIVLWLFFFLGFQKEKGDALVLFRANVTRCLIRPNY